MQTELRKRATEHKVELQELDSGAIQCLESSDGKYAFRFHEMEFHLPLYGQHQVGNAALAIQAAEVLGQSGFSLSTSCMRKGIEATCWMGRIQVFGTDPRIVLDGAHNLDAAHALVKFLDRHTQAPRALLFAMMSDKDIAPVLEVLGPSFERIYLTRVNSRRAASIEKLKKLCPAGIAVEDPSVAYRQVLDSPVATVVVAGSFYLVGEVLGNLSGPDYA